MGSEEKRIAERIRVIKREKKIKRENAIVPGQTDMFGSPALINGYGE